MAGYTESYAPMGDLYLKFNYNDKNYKSYRRELDLSNAKATISYEINNINYKREVFISAPDNAMIIKISADKEKSISFSATLRSLLKSKVNGLNQDTIILKGVTPICALPSYVNEEESIIYDEEGKLGMRFQVYLKARVTEGNVNVTNGLLNIKEASSVTLVLVANTSFNGFDKEPGTEGKDEELLCKSQLKSLEDKSYEEIESNHIDDYRKLFNRVEFCLGNDDYSYLPTNERLERLKNNKEDLGVVSLKRLLNHSILENWSSKLIKKSLETYFLSQEQNCTLKKTI